MWAKSQEIFHIQHQALIHHACGFHVVNPDRLILILTSGAIVGYAMLIIHCLAPHE
jgi:hypothetical protein